MQFLLWEGQRAKSRTLASYAGASLVCALTLALTAPLQGRVDLANIVLLFMLAVAGIAMHWGRGPAVFASLVAVAEFDFFFVPPRFTFTVAHVQYLIMLGAMLLVALLISYLTNAYRDKAAEAEQRAADSTLLQELAGALCAALTIDDAARIVAGFVRTHFGGDSVLYLPDDRDHLAATGQLQGPIPPAELTAVRDMYASEQKIGSCTELREGSRSFLLLLGGATRMRGALALHLPAGTSPDATLPQAIATQVCTAVERIHFTDVAKASELELQSERLRNSLLAAISHDLRTPLTVLYGLADSLVARPGHQESALGVATVIRDQAHHLHGMVENLLEMARLTSSRIELRRDWQSIPELVGASIRNLRPLLAGHPIRLDWAQELPLIELDALLMERVICNLLENAAKYSAPQGAIAIGATQDPGGGFLRLWFDNDGPGFPADRLERIFSLFERGEPESPLPGFGLGLAICKLIIDAHGGNITAENRPGGARVCIRLPLGTPPPKPVEEGQEHV